MQPSGNANFDARVKAHMERKVGKPLPPPPPNYKDILESIVQPTFSGETPGCKNKKPRGAPGAAAPEPEGEAPTPQDSPPPEEPPLE
jgi:hypothetical protein